MKRSAVFASILFSACAVQSPPDAPEFGTTEDELRPTSVNPITVPGVSADFGVVQIADHTFVMQAYANAVLTETKDGLVLVDTMRPAFLGGNDLADMQTTIAYLKAQNLIRSTEVKTIAYTHWHPDHIGNTPAFRGTNTEVVSGRGGVLRLATPQEIKYFGAALPAFPEVMWPSQEVADEERSRDVRFAYAPYSHTTTDLVVTLPKERVVIVGDLVLQGWLAFTDNDNGGTIRGLLASLDKVLADLPASYRVVPGHNKVMTKSELRDWVRAHRDGIAFVGAKIAEGKTLAEIQADTASLPASTRALDGALIPLAAWVDFVYRDLTERDSRALFAARALAQLEDVSTRDMVNVIDVAIAGPENTAGTEYDTLAFQVRELEGIDAQSSGADILSPGARGAFAVYSRYVTDARAAGRQDLTAAEQRAMKRELNALR